MRVCKLFCTDTHNPKHEGIKHHSILADDPTCSGHDEKFLSFRPDTLVDPIVKSWNEAVLTRNENLDTSASNSKVTESIADDKRDVADGLARRATMPKMSFCLRQSLRRIIANVKSDLSLVISKIMFVYLTSWGGSIARVNAQMQQRFSWVG